MLDQDEPQSSQNITYTFGFYIHIDYFLSLWYFVKLIK